MAIPSRQIGWGTEENLLWQISKQLDYLTKVTYNTKQSFIHAANSGYDVPRETAVGMDNLLAYIDIDGAPSLSALSGNMDAYWSYYEMTNGNTIDSGVNTGDVLSEGSWTNIGAAYDLSSGGDTLIAIVQDQNLGTVYRVTFVQTAGPANGTVIIEKLS